MTTLNGDGGTGKSLAALQLAAATALGRAWLGHEVKPGRALFISAEDDRDEIHRRIADIARAEGVSLADMPDLMLRSLAGKDALLAVTATAKGDVMEATPLFLALDRWLAAHRPVLTVLDTLADLFGGTEINRSQARQFISMLRGLAVRHGTTLLLRAHPSVGGMSSGTGSSGSTAWNNSAQRRRCAAANLGEVAGFSGTGERSDMFARAREQAAADVGFLEYQPRLATMHDLVHGVSTATS